MKLFEIVTNYMGVSYERCYVRCYVWCTNRERALEVFKKHYPDRNVVDIRCAMGGDEDEFITKLDSEGWER